MFAYITIGSTEIKFSSSSKEDRKHFLCAGTRQIATTTTSTTQASSPKPMSVSLTSTIPSTYSTTVNTSTSAAPNEAFADSSRGSSTAATAAGVSVAVALAVAAVLIVVGLRKKGVLPCLTIQTTEGPNRRTFEDAQETNYEGMIERNESNESYCVLDRNVVSGEGIVSYINSHNNQNIVNGTNEKYSPEYYNTDSYEYVQKAYTNRDFTNN
ncbi:uncharacterized protein LOC127837720 [Dreissena polymorpha]|nr:uncharacterized protein LOC127837720 [Dreissena polymorpha]